MKKIFLPIALALLAGGAKAETRTAEQALAIARNFVKSTPAFAHSRQAKLTLAPTAAVGPSLTRGGVSSLAPAYYICNVDDKGFVIVSGDDRFSEILGYSDNGIIETTADMPDGLEYWLSFLSEEMRCAIEAGYSPKTTSVFSSLTYDASRSVEPLIHTKWNQDSPYNNKLQGYMTGCVATGMVQVMKYWNYPTKGTGTHTGAYAPNFAADFGSTTYDWDNMLDTYGTGFESKEEVDAVSTLMLHAGVATDMRWGKSQSGTPNNFAAYALHNYFNYNKNLYVESRDHLSLGAWKAMLINQLQSGHPLCYSGMSSQTGSAAGHFFVCDGYDASTDKFHFNWGWGGRFDGYYAVTALEPGTGGIGAGTGSFNYMQSIFVNVQPDLYGEYQTHFDANTVIISGSSKDKVKINTTNLTNNNTYSVKGSLGLAIYDTDGSLYNYRPSPLSLPITNFNIGSSFSDNLDYEVSLGDISDGTYTVCAAVYSERDENVSVIRANYAKTTYYRMTVAGSDVTFESLSTQPDLSASTFALIAAEDNTVYQNVMAHFQVTVTNNSAFDFNDEIGVTFEQSRSNKGTISVPAFIPAGETKVIDVYGAIPANVNIGSATAKAQYGNDGTFNALGSSMSLTVKDEASGIKATPSSTARVTAVYNVAGQRVADSAKGIIIKNGKKYIK